MTIGSAYMAPEQPVGMEELARGVLAAEMLQHLAKERARALEHARMAGRAGEVGAHDAWLLVAEAIENAEAIVEQHFPGAKP